MNVARWKQIKIILGEALEHSPNSLEKYLDEACNGDIELRSEVASFLAEQNQAKNLLENVLADAINENLVKKIKDSFSSDAYPEDETTNLDKIIGRTLGDFLVKEKLGEGGFGAVYKATQITLSREAVIKILHTRHRTNPQIIERFKREALLASQLEHPYCAHIYSFGAESDGLLWIAMEYIAGTTLSELLKTQNALPLERATELLGKICEVVHTAHEAGIIHRDLKPANVMVISRAGRLLPKLLDFGIAKDLTQNSNHSVNFLEDKLDLSTTFAKSQINNQETIIDSNLKSESSFIDNSDSYQASVTKKQINPKTNQNNPKTQETIHSNNSAFSASHLNKTDVQNNEVLAEVYVKEEKILPLIKTQGLIGSPTYMSPEQWDGKNVDARSDIYSLGILAYQLVTGECPFKESGYELYNAHTSKPVPPLKAGFPPMLDTVFQKVLAKKAENRYQTALEFAKAFCDATGYDETKTFLPQLDELLKENIFTNYPTPLADTVANLVAANNTYQFRDRALSVFHVLVHYISILTLTSYATITNKNSENDLINKTIKNLYQRNLTEIEWIDLSRQLCRPFAKKRDIFPIPELVSLFFTDKSEFLSPINETFTNLSQLQEKIHSSISIEETSLLELLTDFLSKLSSLLKAASWLSNYYLVLPEGKQAIQWMGVAKTHTSMPIKSSNLLNNKATLIDSKGNFVLTLWPLIEIIEPTAGAPKEVFLLEGKGRREAKLISFPYGFEIESEFSWNWLKEHFLVTDEKTETNSLPEKSPYLGLATFTPEDSTIFYGREKEVENFLNRLRTQPLVAVVGPSGAGKSSFVQAGIIASLPKNWKVLILRPGISPISTLSTKLLRLGIDIPDLQAKLQKDINILGNTLRTFAINNNLILLLVVDQFEEILTLCPNKEEQHLYVEALSSSAKSEDDPLRVIITMRDDFLTRAKALSGLKDRLSQSLEILTTPDSTQLLRILVLPARRVGYEFEDQDLATEIVEALTEQTSALPLLAFTAAKLWEQRDKQFKQLRRRSYEMMGGVAGALAKHAEELLEKMTQTEQLLVREAFRHLVTSEGTRAILTHQELLELLGKTSDSETVIEKLISARLLVTTEGEKGIDRIEIVHEALLSAWPRLVKWRMEDSEGSRFRDQLRQAVRQWQERNRPKGLLWRDEVLAEYQLWRIHYKGKLTQAEEEFTQASISDATRNQRIRRTLITATILTLIVGSLVLFYQQQRTQKQLLQTLELYEEQGRQELIKDNLDNAAVYLSEAYLQGRTSLAIKYMLSRVLAKLENRPPISLSNPSGYIMMVVFSPDSQLIACVGRDKTAKIWKVSDGEKLFTLESHTDTISTVQFSPDSSLLVTSSLDKTAKIWKVSDGSLLATLKGHTEALRSAIFSPDGKQIVTISYDKTAKIWDSKSGNLIKTLVGHNGAIYDVSYSKDGQLIATASADKTIKIWDSKSGDLKTTFSGHQSGVLTLAFSPDSRLLVTGSIDKTAKIWQIPEGKLLYTLTKHRETITSVQFNIDGKTILTTSKDKTACLWNAETANLLNTLVGHDSDIVKGEFSPDGKLVVTIAFDNTARIWETATGKALMIYADYNILCSGTFSNDGEKILIASTATNIKIWNLSPESRSPKEISLIVKEKVPKDLKEGRLVPREQPLTNEKAKIEKQETAKETTPSDNTVIDVLNDQLKIEMVKIKGGSFEMGSPANEQGHAWDELLHKVTVSPFYIGKYEVTQAQWNAVASLPVMNIFLVTYPAHFNGDDLPVENVSWDEAVEFCARLSKLTGKNYHLPTEAEWEYAARAGSKGPFAGNLDEMAWYVKNSAEKIHPVGQKKPNAWGLYDVHGNVWEWCSDYWYGNYPSTPVVDPKGPISGIYHSFRGGSWFEGPLGCRLALRVHNVNTNRITGVGLRLARTPDN